ERASDIGRGLALEWVLDLLRLQPGRSRRRGGSSLHYCARRSRCRSERNSQTRLPLGTGDAGRDALQESACRMPGDVDALRAIAARHADPANLTTHAALRTLKVEEVLEAHAGRPTVGLGTTVS